MANSKWGTKRMCLGCGKRFYDMRRDPIVCPGCDAPFVINSPTRMRRQRAPVARVAPAPPPEPPAAAEDTEMAVVESEEADTDVEVEEETAETIEDPSELGEDEDDMAEVIEGIEQPEKKDV